MPDQFADALEFRDAPVRLLTEPSEVALAGGGSGAAASAAAGGGGSGAGAGGGGFDGGGGGGGGGDNGGGDGGGGPGSDPAGPIKKIQAAQLIAPVFAVQPANQNIIANDGASFTARASGYPAYQWQASTNGIAPYADVVDGGIFSGATTDTLVLTNVPIQYSGYVFKCVATNTGGTATSNTATLTVSAPAAVPYIITDPVAAAASAGGSASFSVTAGGTAPLVYQWQVSIDGGLTWVNLVNDANYSGTTTANLSVDVAPLSFTGYFYRCRVRNAFGQKFSNGAELTVTTPPPTCSLSCICLNTAGCEFDVACNPISYPRPAPGCETHNENPIPCPCFAPDASYVTTASVSLNLGNMIAGHSYQATVFFRRLDLPDPTASFVWNFTATGPTGATSSTPVPSPAGVGQPGWAAETCSIVEV